MKFRIKSFTNALLIFSLSLVYIGTAANPEPNQFEAFINGQRHELPTKQFDHSRRLHYIDIRELASLLNVKPSFSNDAREAKLDFGRDVVTATAQNPFINIGERIVQMPVDAHFANGRIYVPLPYFVDVISPYYPGSLFIVNSAPAPNPGTVSNAGDQPVASRDKTPARPLFSNIFDIIVEEKANGTLIRVQTGKDFNESHINARITRQWLYIDIYGGKIDKALSTKDNLPGFVRKIVPLQMAQMAQLSFQLRGEVTRQKVFTDNRNHEILVSLTTEERVSKDILRSLREEKKKWLIDTIVIDPGHGGKDPGAIGPGNVYEKNVTLAIAKEVKKLLVARSDVRVVMTREDDRFIPLKDRTKLANREQGKLFISIHANSNRNRSVEGLTTYFLGQANNEEALEVAKRENSVIRYEQDKSSYAKLENEGLILLALAQNSFQSESQELAAIVQKEISKSTSTRDRGVKQAGFSVLIGASMPNILIETAFISNRREAKQLQSKRYQQKVAEGVFNSILRFKKKYESGM